MVENLKRIREPLAWAVVVLAALWSALQLASQLLTGVYVLDPDDGSTVTVVVTWALMNISRANLGLLLALILAAVGCAAAPATPRTRAIALAAAWVATLSVALPWLVGLALVLLGRSESVTVVSGWEMTALLDLGAPVIETAVGVVAVIALWALARRATGDEPDEDEDEDPAIEAPEDDPAPLDPATVWKPSEATGTVWRTADEAAAGVPGTPSPRRAQGAATGPEWAAPGGPSELGEADDWRPPAGR